MPRVKQALFADAIGTTFGAMLGTSRVTIYVESDSGFAEGGRTGLTALQWLLCFSWHFFYPHFFLVVPNAAAAPALIVVGSFMKTPILKVDYSDYTESIPVFLTVIIIPMTNSISEGIVFGMVSYVLLKVLSGQFKKVSIIRYAFVILLF